MIFKRIFDLVFAIMGLFLLSWALILLWIIASIDTRSNGFFIQKRIGQYGKPFVIFKLKTIGPRTCHISAIGAFLRKTKLDECPQLWNVLIGDMSFVGPRPDVAGYYDELQGEEKKILELKPGITSLASVKYRNEENLLANQENPLKYNDEVIFPDKVKMNMEYYNNHSIIEDIKIIFKTCLFFSFFF